MTPWSPMAGGLLYFSCEQGLKRYRVLRIGKAINLILAVIFE